MTSKKEEKEKVEEEVRCTCGDEWQKGLCPVCDLLPGEKNEPETVYIPGVTVLTDRDIVSYEPIEWAGHAFKCHKCGVTILHFMSFCGNCGCPVSIQSATSNKRVMEEKAERQRIIAEYKIKEQMENNE